MTMHLIPETLVQEDVELGTKITFQKPEISYRVVSAAMQFGEYSTLQEALDMKKIFEYEYPEKCYIVLVTTWEMQ